MNISLNENSYTIADGATVLDLLREHRADALNGTAIAVNEEIISRSDWTTVQLQESDSVLLIQATQGG
ncbi:MAG: sulfur carrier protein ThiS [Fibrobacterales bacterium]